MTEEACVAVLIATTNGPVEVQRITEEDPDIDSVVCLAGKAKPLPISGAYHDFVRQPSGVLQRDFGHAAYRVDLSATIEDGYSWQFGLYLAHALHAAGRLASTIDDATHIMFATGEVNIDLDVLGIGHVSAKLESLREQASEYCIQHKTVGFFLPEANADDLEATVRLDEFEIVRCSHVRDALGSLPFELAPISQESAPPPTPPAVLSAQSPAGPPRSRSLIGIISALLLLGIGGATGYVWLASEVAPWEALEQAGRYNSLNHALETASRADTKERIKASFYRKFVASDRPNKDNIRIRLIEHRAPDGKSCAAVRFGVAETVRHKSDRLMERQFEARRFKGLCSLEFIAEADNAETYLWGRYSRWASGETEISDTVRLGPSRTALRWKIELPPRLRADFDMEVVVIASDRPVDGSAGWAGEQVPEIGPKSTAQSRLKAAATLAKRGIAYTDATFKLLK